MPKQRIRVTDDMFKAINKNPKVRRALRTTARRIAGRARSIADREAPNTRITVEDGIRPKGRAYSRVISNDIEGEHGTAKTPRRRILGRAANM